MNSKLSVKYELTGFTIIYIILFVNACMLHDSWIALVSAFCGITYTLLAGKGNPICYLIGLTGSAFYIYLAFSNQFWGNCLLYLLYFVPMQLLGFINWNKNLKKEKYEIIKSKLKSKEKMILFPVTFLISIATVFILEYFKDTNSVFDGFTTTFSILGMYLTVKRAIEQWYVWAGVNLLSLIMWIIIAYSGTKVYSTILMWFVYLLLSVYFWVCWKKELNKC